MCCEGSGLCDELITCSEDPYRLCVGVYMRVIKKPQQLGSISTSWAVGTNENVYKTIEIT